MRVFVRRLSADVSISMVHNLLSHGLHNMVLEILAARPVQSAIIVNDEKQQTYCKYILPS